MLMIVERYKIKSRVNGVTIRIITDFYFQYFQFENDGSSI